MAHPIRPESYIAMDNFYTATVYNKGAEVCRRAAALAGPSNRAPAIRSVRASFAARACLCRVGLRHVSALPMADLVAAFSG